MSSVETETCSAQKLVPTPQGMGVDGESWVGFGDKRQWMEERRRSGTSFFPLAM
jgi:hypothetical protein